MLERPGQFEYEGASACAANSPFKRAAAGGAPGVNASLNGYVPFPATNVWKTDIYNAPLERELVV